jgi:hypothetical protein
MFSHSGRLAAQENQIAVAGRQFPPTRNLKETDMAREMSRLKQTRRAKRARARRARRD